MSTPLTWRRSSTTLRLSLELVVAKQAYKGLLKLKGKFDLRLDLEESREDRSG
jgi:hypothetical protein